MAENASVSEKQLVVFDLAGEHYGVDIAKVREIIQMQTVTRVPGSALFVEGLINLRGVVVPVVDLRKRFGLESTEHDKETRIMVIHSQGQDIGMIVDSVTEVLRIPSDSVEPPSSVVTSSDSQYLLGTAKLPDRLVILLDVDRLLSSQDTAALNAAAPAEKPKASAEKAKAAAEPAEKSEASTEESEVSAEKPEASAEKPEAAAEPAEKSKASAEKAKATAATDTTITVRKKKAAAAT